MLIQNSGSGIFTRVLFKGNTAGHSASVGQTLLLLLFLHILISILKHNCILFYTCVDIHSVSQPFCSFFVSL